MEQSVVYDALVTLQPEVLFDEVLQAAHEWGPENGEWWSAVSAPNSPLMPSPANWMSDHKGAAVIRIVQYEMIVTQEPEGQIGLASKAGVGMGVIRILPRTDGRTRLEIGQASFEYDRLHPFPGEGHWTIDVTTAEGFQSDRLFDALVEQIKRRIGKEVSTDNPPSPTINIVHSKVNVGRDLFAGGKSIQGDDLNAGNDVTRIELKNDDADKAPPT